MESNMDVKQDCKPDSMVKMVTEIVSIFKFEKQHVYFQLQGASAVD
jgi:hypothetical protein